MRAGSRALPPVDRRRDRRHVDLPLSALGKYGDRCFRCNFRASLALSVNRGVSGVDAVWRVCYTPGMRWLFRHRVLVLSALVLAAVAAGGCWLASSHDENYALQEFIFRERYNRYDSLIAQAGERYGVDPSLIKAVIWRESRFQPGMVGTQGERGLMQITERAALDWSRAEKIETFVPTDLFDPKTNIEAGTWYLSKALKQWAGKDDPVPFALAEYNAGRARVKRWERGAKRGGEFGADDLRAAMDFPSTRRYTHSIVGRYKDFQARGEFPGKPKLDK